MGKDIELAILFADVVGSTRLYELMGDLRARDMVSTCIDVMRSATEQSHGTVIKTMGDEVMASFPSADEALNAAAQMQQLISTHAQLKVEGQVVAIRIGCHFGPVVLESRDVFGSTVHTANRMTSQAKAGQIITTAATIFLRSGGPRAGSSIPLPSRVRVTRCRFTRCSGRPRM
jgi:adenylate cyclase